MDIYTPLLITNAVKAAEQKKLQEERRKSMIYAGAGIAAGVIIGFIIAKILKK